MAVERGMTSSASTRDRSDGFGPEQITPLMEAVRRAAGADEIPTEVLARAFEMTYGLAVDSVDPQVVKSSARRRDNGVFYTPSELAQSITDRAIKEVLSYPDDSLSVIDPASGPGTFLIAVFRSMLGGVSDKTPEARLALRRRVASGCLYAIDKDLAAIELARRLIWLEVRDPTWTGKELDSHFRCEDSLSSDLSAWRHWFPEVFKRGGFDVVIGNPPWGAVKARRKEFLEHLDDKVRETYGSSLRSMLSDATTEREDRLAGLWNAYRQETAHYASALRASDDFAYQGESGDRDLYKYFMERAIQIANNDSGVISLIVPAGFLRAKGADDLRRLYLSRGRFVFLTEFINRKRLFPIHSMFRFVVFAFVNGRSTGIHRLSFGATSVDELAPSQRSAKSTHLSARTLSRLGGKHLLVPDIRSAAERRILEKLFSAHPPLGESSDIWNVNFRREIDMTNDSDAFIHISDARLDAWEEVATGLWVDDQGQRYRSVIEGRMVQQFNPFAKRYVSGVGRRAKWVSQSSEDRVLGPQFLLPDAIAQEKGISTTDRAGFRDVTGHANKRTVISAVLPGFVVSGNKVPTCEFDLDDQDLPYLWAALVNSYVLDWIARRYISTTLNFFYLELMPIPRLPVSSRQASALVQLSRTLAGEPLSRTDRAWARTSIDGIVAGLYGLTADEFSVILNDFPLVDSEKRSLVSRFRALLEPEELLEETGVIIDLGQSINGALRHETVGSSPRS
jgi:hypothetical protein